MVSKDVQRFFHVNINCTNFAQSLAFYQLVGFEKILDFDEASGSVQSFGQAGLGPVLGLPDDCDGRAALLALSDESGSTRLDLIEWKQPKLPAERRKSLAQPGIARICLKTSDCDSVHSRLSSAGYVVYSAPHARVFGRRLDKSVLLRGSRRHRDRVYGILGQISIANVPQ